MNVLLISQCSKRALTETRRILDQFAERKGERTWQTAITLAGLETLRKLLRKTARKNTAVACHWIRGKDDSELLWLVGDAGQFNPEGSVPTNTTRRNIRRSDDENDWHSLTLIRQLVAMAALLHDLGKASQAFQDRLQADMPLEKNRYRHEWVSVRLFQAFVGEDKDATWLQRLAHAADDSVDALAFESLWLDHPSGRLLRDGLDQAAASSKPLSRQEGGLPPLASALAWLVLTHHRLPAIPRSVTELAPPALWHGRTIKTANGSELLGLLDRIGPDWNEPWDSEGSPDARVRPYWTFHHGLPVRTLVWRKRAARVAQGLLRFLAMPLDCLQDSYVMHVARMSLMLGDHRYSSLKQVVQRVQGEADYPLFANTDRLTGALLQPLDEHLLGVERDSCRLVHALPSLARELPRLVNHRGLRKRSADVRFRWQDRASDQAAALRLRAAEHGAFIVNMASTGCGKTLGNVRIMNALADPALGLRCAFAIGLRTLTLQTGRSFQRDLGLGDDELAIQVGGEANRELFDYYEQLAEQGGSASRMGLMDESSHVLYEGSDDHPALQFLGTDSGAKKLLAAPMLVCTVDHLMPATEGLRGGRQIAPMLRLLAGDLVLDEPDDFDLTDLPALTRLVHWAGLLGAKLLLSSATLPPALVSGLFMAYLDGRRSFQRNRGQRPGEPPAVCCLWVDEFFQSHADCLSAEDYQQHHQAFAEGRTKKLNTQAVQRRAGLLSLPTELSRLDRVERREHYAVSLRDACLRLHAGHHSVDPNSGKRVSFGLIRMANIDPLIDVALSLFKLGVPEGVHVHLCVYHAQFPLFLRSAIEHRLDTTLDRRDDLAIFGLRNIRHLIDSQVAQDQLFVVLGSPVTEVGRDHDYDWAVVEPSSMRSLIQLAGRVLRHRQGHVVEQPNLLVSNTNLRHFERPGEPAFCRPGFESLDFPLQSHELGVLLERWLGADGCMAIDARPRISPRQGGDLQPARDLVDLEHVRMARQMLPPVASAAPVRRNRLAAKESIAGNASTVSTTLNASSFWRIEGAGLTGGVQQLQPFREETRPMEELVWLPDDDEENCSLYWMPKEIGKWPQTCVPVEQSLNYCIPDDAVQGTGISPWGVSDIMSAMAAQAQAMDMPLAEFAHKFASVRLPRNMQGWRWHPILGFGLRA